MKNFIAKIKQAKIDEKQIKEINNLRSILLKNSMLIPEHDYGTGTKKTALIKRKLKHFVKYSSVNKKTGKLLYKIAKSFPTNLILELGTCLGLSTCYLAMANSKAQIISIEGNKVLAQAAKLNLYRMGIKNVRIINDTFDDVLEDIVPKIKSDFILFIDGNHNQKSVLRYVTTAIPKMTSDSLIILDDIRWSADMYEAWKKIKTMDCVTFTIDLFFMGIIFGKSNLKK